MSQQLHYVPILKFKTAERTALKNIPDALRPRFTPLFEVDCISDGDDSEASPELLMKYLEKIPKQIADSWGSRPFYMDLWQFDDSIQTDTGEHPIAWLLRKCKEKKLQAIPVTGIERSGIYQEAIARSMQYATDVCIRLEISDISVKHVGVPSALAERLGVRQDHAHLLLDCEIIDESRYSVTKFAVDSLPVIVPNINSWASFIIAGSAFPESMGSVQKGVQYIPRLEWRLYQEVIAEMGPGARIPHFSDYGINYVFPMEGFDPTKMSASANIRYTVEDEWLILKGQSLKKGYDQYHDLAARLIEMSEYCGREYSSGDDQIYHCAKRETSTGSPQKWREIGASHHMTFIINQLARIHAS
jgi:hypothetical protein